MTPPLADGPSDVGTVGSPINDIARLYWDLHTGREPAEHLITA